MNAAAEQQSSGALPLPQSLAERAHGGETALDAAVAGALASVHARRGEYVLYWARTAVRAHENPALDVALLAARQLDLPVFVYHALSERYPFASDRHHLFILEGARDFAAELSARRIGTAFHLERAGHRGPHLVSLATRAALVVTERMPVAPLAEWTAALEGEGTAPVLQVDTACVVPMPLVRQAYDRAFTYRDATASLRAERVSRSYTEVESPRTPYVPVLPFEPVDLTTADLAALVATCAIDHGVAPVPHTRGGSVAGYARWQRFVSSGALGRYHESRNDPVRADGVSRMSAYLHYGMVSPFRLAREAYAYGGEGATKWIEELLVWRELAYAFCDHRPEHASVHALPEWARATLAAHEGDARVLMDWESLTRGRTPDAFWNAMQASLRVHGELHNNVRMTWGKAIPSWTRDAASALAMLVDLNHRYALDGRDPASFGGLLWCLGQFDRPFTPDNPVLGAVRGRDSSAQSKRVDARAYAAHAARPLHGHSPRVAVVGAGLAGLMCARTLADHGIAVTVFEKSRGVGGRCATRREGSWQFDHGAQYFTARDNRLAPFLAAWRARGLVQPWQGRIAVHESGAWSDAGTDTERWVASPGMSALGKHLAADLDVRLGVRVASVEQATSAWLLSDDAGVPLGDFDVVLVAAPAPQAASLLHAVAPAVAAYAESVAMHPTWATMLAFDGPLHLPFDAAFVNDHPSLGWIARQRTNDASSPGERWVLHAHRAWSSTHLEEQPEVVGAAMTQAFTALVRDTTTSAIPAPVFERAHRWRYAIADATAQRTDALEARYHHALGIGVAGDWCGTPRIEGALLSGVALAGHVLRAAHGALPVNADASRFVAESVTLHESAHRSADDPAAQSDLAPGPR